MFKRKTIKKIILFLIIAAIGTIAAVWAYYNFFMTIDTDEINGYYDLLSRHGKPSEYLVLDLGVKEPDDIQIAMDRIKGSVGLEDYDIWIEYHDTKDPPAFIKKTSYGVIRVMIISLYKGITQKREQITLLTHELGHVYVWNLGAATIEGCDEEKVVDSSGIFCGLGILILNGLTDDLFIIPGGEYQTEKKFYGYLKPEQFGYLLARYCAEHGIEKEKIMPFLNSAGRKYFNIGCRYFARQNKPVKRAVGEAIGAYWCPECGHLMRFSLAGETKDLKCPKCSRPLAL